MMQRVDNPPRICDESAGEINTVKPRATPMPETQVRAFFDRYAAAFSALDPAGILDHFDFPCQIATEDAGYAFADRPAIEADMTGFVQFYADHGFARAELAKLDYQPLSETFGLAHVNWRLVNREGESLVDVATTYILRHGDGGPAIIGILGHNEDGAWRRRGIAAGQLAD